MIDCYVPLKLVHIVSSTLLFGTGLGTAFFMWRADRSRDPVVIAAVARSVVLADWVFTAPAAVIQPLSGFLLLSIAQIPLTTPWVLSSLVLYVLIGLCWLPVVWLQIRVAANARRAQTGGGALGAVHDRYMTYWYRLGWPAFIGVLVIFYLMVRKPLLW